MRKKTIMITFFIFLFCVSGGILFYFSHTQVFQKTPAAASDDAAFTADTEVLSEKVLCTEKTEGTEETEDLDNKKLPHEKVKGIYVTGPVAGSSRMDELISLLDETELNTMVIDVKNDDGNITYNMNLNCVQETNACIRYIQDIDVLMQKLKEHQIYTIARIVCFKDPVLAEANPDLALRKADGTLITDANGLSFVNPYKKECWEYLTQIAVQAAENGFDEIQFDYVRFPVGEDAAAADYGVDTTIEPKQDAIKNFLSYVKEYLHEKDIVFGADVFGTIIGNDVDAALVGQDYQMLGEIADVLSPMVYPSHYGTGVYGFDVPDAHPYETVYQSLNVSKKELSASAASSADIRPWLQAFTAVWVPNHLSYGGDEIRAQIQAVYDAGYEEWILWNASNRYTTDGLLSDE